MTYILFDLSLFVTERTVMRIFVTEKTAVNADGMISEWKRKEKKKRCKLCFALHYISVIS